MGKISELEKRQRKLEEQFAKKETKPKPFKLPGKINRMVNKGNKLPDSIVTQYLTQKGEIRFKTQRIVSGNIIVVNNKAHKLNPKYLWKFGKKYWYIHREIDRRPVSNEDYEEVKNSHNDTDSDVVLIKAVLGAMQKPKKEIKSKWIVWIVFGIIAAVVLFVLFGGA